MRMMECSAKDSVYTQGVDSVFVRWSSNLELMNSGTKMQYFCIIEYNEVSNFSGDCAGSKCART